MSTFKRSKKETKTESFLISASLFLLFLIWFVNPTNKFLLIIFLVYLLILSLKLKSLSLGAFFTFILSSIFLVGKDYFFQLHDLRQLPYLKILYPLGLFEKVTITTSDVIFSIFLISLIPLLKKTKISIKNLQILDFLIIIFIIFGLITDILSSRYVYLSLFLKKSLLQSVAIYFYLRFLNIDHKFTYKSIVIVFTAIVFFESFLVLQQFVNSSPLGKNYEIQRTAQLFGSASDESSFTFRPNGTFYHANDLGLFLSSLLPFIFIEFLINKKGGYVVGFFLGTLAVVLTLSRSAWLGISLGFLYLLFVIEYKKKINLLEKFFRKKYLIFLVILTPLVLYILPRIAQTAFSFQESGGLYLRIRQVQESWELLKSSPLLGIGTGMSVVEAIERNKRGIFSIFPNPVHNYYVLLLVENGLALFFLFLLVVIYGIKKIVVQYKSLLASAALSSLIVILIGALFQPAFNYQLLFILLGIDFSKIGYGDKIS